MGDQRLEGAEGRESSSGEHREIGCWRRITEDGRLGV